METPRDTAGGITEQVMTRAGLVLVLLATVSGCAGREMAEFEYCDPVRTTLADGVTRVFMRTPCVGWSDGSQVARYPERLPVGPYPPHKSMIIYRDGRHVEAVVFDKEEK